MSYHVVGVSTEELKRFYAKTNDPVYAGEIKRRERQHRNYMRERNKRIAAMEQRVKDARKRELA